MILFRADGNSIVGSGHIMRCLSIADAFRNSGENCIFVIADDEPKELIASRGFETITLGTRYDCLEEETEMMRSLLQRLCPDFVILDTYFVTEKYMNFLNEICRLVYIDDLGAFPYPCRALVNYNAYGPYMGYEKLYEHGSVKVPLLCLGIKYAPLREEFHHVGAHIQPERVSRVMVSTGGADPCHIAIKIIRTLLEKEIKYDYHFLVGAMNGDAEEICSLAGKSDRIIVHRNVGDMKALLMESDIAVSAAGSTLYELCACGVPTITYVCADNQKMGAEAFQKMKLMKNIGDIRNLRDYEVKMMEGIDRLADDFILRKEISANMQGMIDGCGASRLVEKILTA